MIRKFAAGGVVIDGGKVLTISWTNQDYIAFPKGGIKKGESSEDAAVREVFEETGYHVKIDQFLESMAYQYDNGSGLCEKTVDYYLMILADKSLPNPKREPGEDFENLWLSVDEAFEKLTLDDSKKALKLAIKYQGKG